MALNIPSPDFLARGVTPPDILGAQERAATLSQMLNANKLQQALAPLQIQEQQQKVIQQQQANEINRIQLQDSRVLSDYFKNGNTGEEATGDFSMRDKIAAYTGVDKNDPMMGFLSGLAKAGLSGPGLLAQAQAMTQKRTEYNKGTVELQNIQKTERLLWQETLTSLNDLPEDQRSVALAAKLPLLAENSKSDPLLATYAKGLAGHPELIPQAFTAVSGENAALGLRKAKAEAAAAEQKVIPEGGGMSPETKQQLAKDVAVATNPEVQAGKMALTRMEATAREQVQASMLPLLEQVRQQFGNQKDARDKIESNVLKPYQEKMTDVQMARTAIAQAQDNPVSARAAIFKMVGVAQPTGSHRVLPMEFAAFKYPGGITDQVKEKFNDFLKGEPWTPEIAAAANAFIDGQAGAAQRSLNSGIDNTNKLYGTNVGTGLKSETKEIHYKIVNGQLVPQ